MMKRYEALLVLHVLCLSSVTLQGMETPQQGSKVEKQQVPQGPMDYEWFYDENNVFYVANRYHQEQDWQKAASLYQDYLNEKVGTAYDQNKARLNLAACLMAQRQATEHWAAFDALLNIAESRRISDDTIRVEDKKSVLVRTDQVGIGDIFCFLPAVARLKKYTGWHIKLSVPHFLTKTLAEVTVGYGFEIISAKEESIRAANVDYETHLIALLGHLELTPGQMKPKRVMGTAPESAINTVLEIIYPILAQGKIILMADKGEVGRIATLIGGKQLPRNTENHGRHLDSKPFKKLLRNHSDLVLLDCSGEKHRITMSDKQKNHDIKNRYMIMPKEQQPFDMPIALTHIMNAKEYIMGKRIMAIAPDMGQGNVVAGCLESDAQNRMTIVIPNAREHDMRTSGQYSLDDPFYKHMLSNCWVGICQKPADQTKVIEQAYQRMLTFTQ